MLEALPAAIYATDAQGRNTFYNKAAVVMAGRTAAVVVSLAGWHLVMQVVELGGFVANGHQLCSVVFYCFVVAQASGAALSCAYPWHRGDHDDDDDVFIGRKARGSEPLRMLWHPV